VKRGRSIPWPFGEFGPSEVGGRARELIDRRLRDPSFALTAAAEDAAMANLGI
jgi:hypothetical protein